MTFHPGVRGVIALDLSLAATGVAQWFAKDNDENYFHHFVIRTSQKQGNITERIDIIREKIHPMDGTGYAWFIESYAHKGHNTLLLAELNGVIKNLLLRSFDVTPFAVAPTTIKKWITGSGTADKIGVMRAVDKKFRTECPTEHEADAIALVDFGRHLLGFVPRKELTKEQQKHLKTHRASLGIAEEGDLLLPSFVVR